MNTQKLTPNSVHIFCSYVAYSIQEVICKISLALEHYEATNGIVDRRFTNYTRPDIELLERLNQPAKVKNFIFRIANRRWRSNCERLFQTFDVTFSDIKKRAQVKQALELMVRLRLSKKVGDIKQATQLLSELQDLSIQYQLCRSCDYCNNCTISQGLFGRAYTCDELVTNCPNVFNCEKFETRIITLRGDV